MGFLVSRLECPGQPSHENQSFHPKGVPIKGTATVLLIWEFLKTEAPEDRPSTEPQIHEAPWRSRGIGFRIWN